MSGTVTFYAGIDPGLDGAVALYDPVHPALHVFDMPTHTITVNKKVKRRLDLHGLVKLLKMHSAMIKKAVIEEVSAMPGQGVTSCFNFGFSTGATNMALAACEIAYTSVAPVVWKRAMKITADKEGARREASRLLPSFSENWALKKHDGRAEAALLAYWLSKQEGVKPDKMQELM